MDARETFDVAVIGAGVVGCALARELSRYALSAVLLEAASDPCEGASKGNTAILCTGYDTPPNSLERQLVRRGYERYRAEGPALGLSWLETGVLTVARDEPQMAALAQACAEAKEGGFAGVTLLEPSAVYARVPRLAPGAVGGLWAPGECVVDPFSTAHAYALDALANGVAFRPSAPVVRAVRHREVWELATPSGALGASVAINCAGLKGDAVDRLAGFDDFTIRPRRGQFVLFDKSARPLLDTIVKSAPAPGTRGIYITPTAFGNVILGPTAEEVDDPDDVRVTEEGLRTLFEGMAGLLPALGEHAVTTCYAGMRPASERPEYRIVPRLAERWITVGGIRSTGLSAALGIAEYVAAFVVPDLVRAPRKRALVPVRAPSLVENGARPWMDAARIAADPAYGEIVCHCERITLGEIRDALESPLPPRSLKALKRRTRAMFGRCQGFYCGARIEALFRAAHRGSRP